MWEWVKNEAFDFNINVHKLIRKLDVNTFLYSERNEVFTIS